MAIRAIKTVGGKAVSSVAGTGGSGTFSAPNITLAWLTNVKAWALITARNKVVAPVVVAVGYQGTITPPIGVDTTHLKEIQITRINGEERQTFATLGGPFPTGVARDFKSSPFDEPGLTGVQLEFLCVGDDGPTPNPFVMNVDDLTTFTNAPAESSITAQEIPPRHKSPDGGLNIVLGFSPYITNVVYPITITMWTTRPARTGESGPVTEWRGWWVLEDASMQYIGQEGTKSAYDVWPPVVSDEYWTMTFALGQINDGQAIPSTAKTSPQFFVAAPAVPSPTGASHAYIDEVVINKTVLGAARTGRVRTGMWGWQNLFCDLPFDDPEFVTARWTVQNGSYGVGGTFVPGGQHDGEEKAFTDLDGETVMRLQGTNTTKISNPLLWDVPDYKNTDGTLNPNNVFRFRIYIESRNNQDGTGGAWTQQQCWSSGVGDSNPGTLLFQDVVLDLTSGRYLGSNLATTSFDNVSHRIPGVTIPTGSDGTLAMDGVGNIIVNQPALVITNLSGNLTVSRISNLNTVAVASFSGNLDITRVTNVNTIQISTLTGNLDISRVTNVNTININTLSGNLDVSRVQNITLLFIYQFQGNLDISRVNNFTNIAIASFQGNLDVSRVNNITTISISNFPGNLDISRVSNISQINIGTLSGTLNVTYQVTDGSIPINKIATLYVNNIQGWDGGAVNVGSGGFTFNGTGAIRMPVGNVSITNQGITCGAGYWAGTFNLQQLIFGYDLHANFSYLQIQGSTRIDSSGSFTANNLSVSGVTTLSGTVLIYGTSIFLAGAGFSSTASFGNTAQFNGTVQYGSETGVTTGAIGFSTPGGGTVYLRFTKGGLVAMS